MHTYIYINVNEGERHELEITIIGWLDFLSFCLSHSVCHYYLNNIGQLFIIWQSQINQYEHNDQMLILEGRRIFSFSSFSYGKHVYERNNYDD